MRVARECLSCGTISRNGTRCPTCEVSHRRGAQRRQDGRRGTSSQRGYGVAHQALRASLAPVVAAGDAVCWRCRRPIHPAEPWHLGHADGDPTRHMGPEHAGCNVDASNGKRADDRER